MDRKKLRGIGILLIGAALSGCSVMGIQSLGLVFFIAAYMERLYRWILFPLLLVSMSIHMTTEQLMKYGVAMAVTMFVVAMIERKSSNPKKELGYISMGASVILMSATERMLHAAGTYTVVKGVVEGVFVMSSGYLLGMFIRYLMELRPGRKRQRKRAPVSKEQWFLAGAGRERLLACAEAYRNLARTFSGLYEAPTGEYPLSEERKDYLWKRKLMENRVVMAGQFSEMAQIMTDVAEDICGIVDVGEKQEERISRCLKKRGIAARNVLVAGKKGDRTEVYITARALKCRQASVKEIAGIVSEVCGRRYVPAVDTVGMIYKEYTTLRFEEDANFRLLSGIAKVTKENEPISGDNYSVNRLSSSRMICALSDGMGSGESAYHESETVVELLEQFMEAGFNKESAVQMVNSFLISRSEEQSISTVDMCDFDLYDGVCEFLKMGASATFIKRDDRVETVSSSSLPLGVFNQLDVEVSQKKLYDGDYVIMVTDGVLDRILEADPEEALVGFIEEISSVNPNEIAKQLMYKILSEYEESIHDDMTIIVLGIWKK